MWDEVNSCPIKDDAHFLLVHEELDAEYAGVPPSDLCEVEPASKMERRMAAWREACDFGEGPATGFGVWGDAGAFSSRDSLYILLWNVITCQSIALRNKRNPFVCFSKRGMCKCPCMGRHTIDDCLRVMGYCWCVLKAGVYPLVRDDGVPFKNSNKVGDSLRAAWGAARRKTLVRGGPVQERADWAWRKSALGMNGWKQEGPNRRVCFKCHASKSGTHPFTDPSRSATWRGTCVETYLFLHIALSTGAFVSAIFEWPGWGKHGCSFMEIDLMHVGCLGIVQYLLGNVLHELFVEMGGTSTNWKETCGHLNMLIKQAARKLDKGPPVNQLTLNMMKSGAKAPKLKAKAAESRHMLAAVCKLLETYLPPKNDYQNTRYNCVKYLALFYEEVADWTPGVSPAKVKDYARRHLELYLELARHYIDDLNFLDTEWVRYRWYPKHHLFSHLVDDDLAFCDNPRDCWCYGDESFLGEMIGVAEAVNAKVVHRSVMTTFRL